MRYFIDSILFSYAQILFSNRRWLGIVMLAATFTAPQLGLISLLGVVISNLTAHMLKFDEGKIRSGFYGFNGILIGAAAVFYFELSPFLLVLLLLFVVITFFMSAMLEHLMASMFNLPGLSLPFVLTLFVFLIFLTNFDTLQTHTIAGLGTEFLAFLPEAVTGYFNALALILFQPSALVGIAFAISFLMLSRVMFLLSVIGYATAHITVNAMFGATDSNIMVVAGFNAILTAIALGGALIIPSRKSLLLTLFSGVIIVVLTGFFVKLLSAYRLPVLVLPFNFAVLTVLYSLKFRREHSDLVLLYFLPGTPEENYYYHHNRVSRFEQFKSHVAELPFFGEWSLSQGHSGDITHKDKWQHAWDFVVVDEQGSEHSGKGTALTDYYCYKLPVVAPLDGTVVRVVDGVPNNPAGETNLKSNWGNTVIVDHGKGLFSAVSHLEPYSTKVNVGDRVKKGDALGQCGNSGRSPTPHLHFQFQATEKLGDRTLDIPVGQYLEHTDQGFVLHSFDVPAKGMRVQNIGMHKGIRKAFNFTLGDKLRFQCVQGERSFEEEWEVKVDMNNVMFIESSRNATATLMVVGKVFYLTNFVGNRDTALYHFYLCALQVPLAYEPDLVWSDEYPLSKLLNNAVRYVSEFFLIFAPQFRAAAKFRFVPQTSETSDFVIENEVQVLGSGIFSFYQKQWKGLLTIARDGGVREIRVAGPGTPEFTGTAISIEETTP